MNEVNNPSAEIDYKSRILLSDGIERTINKGMIKILKIDKVFLSDF